MSTLEQTAYETGREGFDPIGLAGRTLRFAYRAMKMRSERAALQAMPDYLLKDMGISRSQIYHYTAVRFAQSGPDGSDA